MNKDVAVIDYIIETWNTLCKEYRAEFSYELDDNIILLHTSYHEEESYGRLRCKNGILTIEYLELPPGLQNRGFITAFINEIENKDNDIKEIRFLSVKENYMAELFEKRGYTSYTMADFPRKCYKLQK